MSNRTAPPAILPQRRLLATAVSLALSIVSAPALAQPQPAATADEEATTLAPVKVRSSTITDGYKAEQSASAKFTAPLLDTPKSITIITQDLIQQRGSNSLTDILRTTPGITLGSGEGGTPVGDRPFIRGYEASTDLMIDGMRDVGRFSHEAFNLEQVEVVKGPGSAYSGRGATGGTINMVSKAARAEDFIAGSVGLGTDNTRRFTVDVNQQLGDGVAFRLNAMKHDADVAGRDELEVSRWGVAPTLALGLDGKTRVDLSFYHLETDDLPDLGHPFSSLTGKPADVDRDNFYGFVDRDYRRTSADIGTVSVLHHFSDTLRVRNATRYGRSMQDYIMTRPTFAGNTDAARIANELAGLVDVSGRTRNGTNETLINQTDLSGEAVTGSVRHSFAAGIEISREEISTKNRFATAASAPLNLHNPNPHAPFGAVTLANQAISTTEQDVRAAYVFDTLRLNEQWEINLGLRFDDYKVKSGTLKSSSNFWNYQTGLVYKPADNGSVYISYGTSSNPSGETQGQSGGADGAAGGNLSGNKGDLDPEKNRSFELGTKWDVFGEKLALTAAIFRTEKTNGRATDPVTGDVALIGDSRVDGIEFGAAGAITDSWQVWAGYTYLDSEVIDDGAGPNKGNQFKFIAPQSFSLWTTYNLTQALAVGVGANYQGARYVNDANTLKYDSYWRYDAMVSYQVNKNLGLRLNLLNLADETIYDGSHVGLFANVAPGRSALLTADIKF